MSDGAAAPQAGSDGEAVRAAPTRSRRGRILLWIAGAAVVVAALATLNGQWGAVRTVASSVAPQWGLVGGSALTVLAAYAVLIWTWRSCVADAGSSLGYGDSARIWFVSNLARYLPGALWQMGALAVLAKDSGASASAATSAALVLTAINTLCGIGLALVFLPGMQADALTSLPVVPIAVGIGALVALRWFGPALLTWVTKRTGMRFQMPVLGMRLVTVATVGSVVSWLAYGVAFKLLVDATVPSASLGYGSAIAIYVGSYLAGFLSLGPPAGLGVADGAMVWLLTGSGLASPAEAAVIAAVTRLWRTALEIAPGLVFLALQRSRGSRIP